LADSDRTMKGLSNDILDELQSILSQLQDTLTVINLNMFNYSFATGKSKFIDNTSATTPATDTVFYCIVPNEETVVNAMTVASGWPDYSGKTIAQGIPIYTNCSSITLTSGSITAYQRSST